MKPKSFALRARLVPLPLLQPQAPGQIAMFAFTEKVEDVDPCPVESCPVGKPERWDALGDDSPEQDLAMEIHAYEHDETA